jgi:hypothetical protein
MSWRTEPPRADEYAPFYAGYIAEVRDADVLVALERTMHETLALLSGIDERQGGHRYAPGKWSIKEVVGHLADSERVFAYRALRFARADATGLSGFDENAWVPAGSFDARSLAELRREYEAVRRSSLTLFGSLDEAAAMRRGVANGQAVTVRALAWIIPGHDHHHATVIRERYLGGAR